MTVGFNSAFKGLT